MSRKTHNVHHDVGNKMRWRPVTKEAKTSSSVLSMGSVENVMSIGCVEHWSMNELDTERSQGPGIASLFAAQFIRPRSSSNASPDIVSVLILFLLLLLLLLYLRLRLPTHSR